MKKSFPIALPSARLEDPHLCTDSHAQLSMRRLLFSGMTGRRGDDPDIAVCERWESDHEGKVWTFFIKKGFFFPDQRELSAEDIVYSMRRASSPEASGQLYTVTLHDYIGGADFSVRDRYTVILKNPEPISDLPELLADLFILPAGWTSYRDGTGTGPFELLEREENRTLLRRNRAWRKGGQPGGGLPEYLEFVGEASTDRRIQGVMEGVFQAALDPPTGEVGNLQNSSMFTFHGWDTTVSVAFFAECGAPPFNRVGVRQALNYAVDTGKLIEKIVFGHAKALNGPFSEAHFARDPDLEPYPFDPEKARALLKREGLAGGFPVEIHAPDSIPEEGPSLARFLAEAFREIGLEPTVRIHRDRRRYAQDIAEKKLHGLFCFDSSPHSSYKVLHEKLDSRFAGTWWQGYHSDRVNKLISRAAASSEDTRRREVYHEAYRILHVEAPWIFLYQPERFWLARKDTKPQLKVNSLGFF